MRTRTLRTLGITSLLMSGTVLANGFVDVTETAGLGRSHSGSDIHMGAGLAWLDYDSDGDYDLYLTDVGGGSLYRNELRETGLARFTDVTLATGAWDGRNGQSVSAVDYDNDGDQDLFLGNFDRNTLLRNQLAETGIAEFLDVTEAAGLDDGVDWAQSGTWGDFDADGFLDLYVGGFYVFENYVCGGGETGPACAPDHLYRNQGDGTFVDVAPELGMDVDECHFVTVWTDYDSDGDLDLWSGYDRGKRTILWRNDGPDPDAPWGFTQVDLADAGIDYPISDMGIAVGDVDRDGWLDYYHANGGTGNKLFLNDTDGSFTEIALAAGVEVGHDAAGTVVISWGDVITDLDNDGWRDIYVVTGYIDSCAPIPNTLQYQTNQLFINDGGGLSYTESAHAAGLAIELDGRGLAAADYDEDGDVDLAIGNPTEGYLLMRNELTPRADRRWVEVRPIGIASNRDAVGTRVEIEADGALFVDEVRAGSSLVSMNSRALEFGLGGRDRIDRLSARFPSGRTVELRSLEVDRIVSVHEPTADLTLALDRETGRPGDTITIAFEATQLAPISQLVEVVVSMEDAAGVRHPVLRRGPNVLAPGTTVRHTLRGPVRDVAPGAGFIALSLVDPTDGRVLQIAYADFEVLP